MELSTIPNELMTEQRNHYADHLLGFVIDGWLTEQSAKELTQLSYEDRQLLSTQIQEISESDTSSGEQQRAEWVAGILARDVLSETARTVFVETASLRPQRGRKQGLSTRAWSGGRHSSPETSDW